MHQRARLLVSIAAAAVMTVVWVLPVAAASSATATNLVANPSGVGGSTADWGTGRSVDSLSAVQVGGQWWLHWSTPQTAYDWVVYKFPPTAVTAGTEYACGFEAMGSGTIYAMLYDGKNLNRGTALKLTDTPQVFTESATAVNPSGPVEIQARINAGPANVYFNEVTCVAGSSVTIPLEAVTLPASLTSASTASSSTTASTSTSSAAPSATSSTTSTTKASSSTTSTASSSTTSTSKSTTLPKTGESPLVALAGLMLALAGATMLVGFRLRLQ